MRCDGASFFGSSQCANRGRESQGTLLLQKIELLSRSAEDVTVRLEINTELVEMESVADAKE